MKGYGSIGHNFASGHHGITWVCQAMDSSPKRRSHIDHYAGLMYNQGRS